MFAKAVRGRRGGEGKQEEGESPSERRSEMYSSHCGTLGLTGLHIPQRLRAAESTQAHPALVRSYQQEGH